MEERDMRFLKSLGADPDGKIIGHLCSRCGVFFKTREKFDAHPCPALAKEIIKPLKGEP